MIRNASYQASSIRSRRHLGSFLQLNDRTPSESPPPAPPSLPPQPPSSQQELKPGSRQAKDNRLLSQPWLMSAATFRRLGKIEQAKAAIQEAEVKDEGNPAVWVQVSTTAIQVNSSFLIDCRTASLGCITLCSGIAKMPLMHFRRH